jgi:3-hydroxyisobutyrate dehydrogenase-like beta-hydroxyacid dehydrogenase
MVIKAIGILSPGDMGHSVGRVLVDHNLKVFACLEGRSNRTKQLAHEAGIQEVPSYSELVRHADILLSILVPSEAIDAATKVSLALLESGASLIYVDCNAVSPKTKKRVGRIITQAGSQFVDVGIIGLPPGRGVATKFYASGPQLDEFMSLARFGLDVRKVGVEIGQASGLKMAYAAMSKGYTAICTEALTAASEMGLYDLLIAELKEDSQRYKSIEHNIQTMVYRARRWVGEMEEIANTFADLGLTPKIHQGAADIYRLVGKTTIADETPETLNRKRTLAQTIDAISTVVPMDNK